MPLICRAIGAKTLDPELPTAAKRLQYRASSVASIPIEWFADRPIMARGVTVDHATLDRWVIKYSLQPAQTAQKRKIKTAESWHLDETYVKVRGEWVCLYRAVDRNGQTLDFMPSEVRDTAAGIKEVNKIFKRLQISVKIDTVRLKYVNNAKDCDETGLSHPAPWQHRFVSD